MHLIHQRVILIGLLALLGTITVQRPVAAAPAPETYTLGEGKLRSGAGRRVVWIAANSPIDGNVYTADLATRTVVGLEVFSDNITDSAATDGQIVVWSTWPSPYPELQLPKDALRTIWGKDMNRANGRTFVIATIPDTGKLMEPPPLFLENNRVFWLQTNPAGRYQLMLRDLTTMAPAQVILTFPSAPLSLTISSTTIAWGEHHGTAPNSSSWKLFYRPIDSAAPPTQFAQIQGIDPTLELPQLRLTDGYAVWTSNAGLFSVSLADGHTTQLATHLGEKWDFTVNHDTIAYRSAAGIFVANLKQGTIRHLATAGSHVTINDQLVCWKIFRGNSSGEFPIHRPQCYDQVTGQSMHWDIRVGGEFSDFTLVGDNLIWSINEFRGSAHDLPIINAAPLTALKQQGTAVALPPTPSDNGPFQRLWDQVDAPVATGQANRSWTWGPAPISPVQVEAYLESPLRQRAVVYYDKSRMEITSPTTNPTDQWYVTNGLLPVELITGRQQVGNNEFVRLPPASITAIGDPGQFPAYADLAGLVQAPGPADPTVLNTPATRHLNPDGRITTFSAYAADPATVQIATDHGHGIPQAFRTFMNQHGPVQRNGHLIEAALYDPLFVFGHPISAPYWVTVTVGGTARPVLFQVFERRVLTYTPANAPAFQVEMGNVGQHYYQWRYGIQPKGQR